MKKVLLTGARGQLGLALRQLLENDGNYQVVSTDIDSLDLTDAEAVESCMAEYSFGYVVNCAAYTDVNRAETEQTACERINTMAVENIGRSAHRHGAKVIHISTDYVFNGENYRPYTEDDNPAPCSAYGRTKLDGEGLLCSYSPDCVIIRTAWLYSESGNNFVRTMLRLGLEKDEVGVVSDQIGTPTYAGDLAAAIKAVLDCGEWHPGIYHFSNEGVASWYDFAAAVMRLAGLGCKVKPIPSSDYPTPARRPFYSVLDKSLIKKTYGLDIPHWEQSLALCLERLAEVQKKQS